VTLPSSQERPSLLWLLPDELTTLLREDGVPCDDSEVRRLYAAIVADGMDEPKPRVPVRRVLREAVTAGYRWDRLEVLERVTDPDDGFVKYLFRSPDGALSEAVRIPLEKEGRFTVCLSSQVGCAMACDFCATGRLGLTRNLKAWEMVAAFLTVRDEIARDETPGRLAGAVFMGQGEPFANYDEVLQTCRIINHPCGGRVAREAITISTVGLTEKIRRYTREGHDFRLIVSLHSAVPERRKKLLPVVGQRSLEELAAAIREHAVASRGRMTVAWTLLGGVNTGEDEAQALFDLLGDVPLRINLIDVNDAREDGYVRASDDERNRFIDALQPLGAPIVRRYSGGQKTHAACGMLVSRATAADTAEAVDI